MRFTTRQGSSTVRAGSAVSAYAFACVALALSCSGSVDSHEFAEFESSDENPELNAQLSTLSGELQRRYACQGFEAIAMPEVVPVTGDEPHVVQPYKCKPSAGGDMRVVLLARPAAAPVAGQGSAVRAAVVGPEGKEIVMEPFIVQTPEQGGTASNATVGRSAYAATNTGRYTLGESAWLALRSVCKWLPAGVGVGFGLYLASFKGVIPLPDVLDSVALFLIGIGLGYLIPATLRDYGYNVDIAGMCVNFVERFRPARFQQFGDNLPPPPPPATGGSGGTGGVSGSGGTGGSSGAGGSAGSGAGYVPPGYSPNAIGRGCVPREERRVVSLPPNGCGEPMYYFPCHESAVYIMYSGACG